MPIAATSRLPKTGNAATVNDPAARSTTVRSNCSSDRIYCAAVAGAAGWGLGDGFEAAGRGGEDWFAEDWAGDA